jgi:hypothetical protein
MKLTPQQKQEAVSIVRKWVETFIVGLNLCPFAKAPLDRGAVRFSVGTAKNLNKYLELFDKELDWLERHPETETTLLILPGLDNAEHLMSLLQHAEQALIMRRLGSKYQVVSFHPQNRFSGLPPESPENLVGIGPLPILHLLRAASVERLGAAVKHDVQEVNSRRLRALRPDEVKALWEQVLG